MYIPALGPFSHNLFFSESLGHEGIGGLHDPFGDHFLMMDPMERRHGLFAYNGTAMGGGGRATSEAGTLSGKTLGPTLFPGERPPFDANVIPQVVQRYELAERLKEGAIFSWQKEIPGGKIPLIYSLCELPANHADIFNTLLDVNGTAAWMPRLEWFRTTGEDAAADASTFRRRFNTSRSLHLEGVEGKFKTSGPIMQGRFIFDYRQVPGGLQMEWNLKGNQEFPQDKGAKRMQVNHSSFTLHPVPDRPNATWMLYHLNVQPHPDHFLLSMILMFVPSTNANEQDRFFHSLLNRTVDTRWTGKTRDPLGLDLSRAPNPSGFQYKVSRLY